MNAGLALFLGVAVAGCAALSVLAPLPVLLLGPLLLGVPHVLGDLRFLWTRPLWAVPHARLAWIGIPLAGMVGTRMATMAGFGSFLTVEVVLGLAALGLAVVAAPGPGRWLGMIGVAIVGLPALMFPQGTALWLGHVHNVAAIGLWAVYAGSRGQRGLAVAGVVAAAGGAAAVVSSPLPSPDTTWGGLKWGSLLDTLAPGVQDPWASRAVILYTFLQLLHYGVWTFALPIVARPGAGWSGWWRELGPTLAVAGVIGAVALPVAGWFSPAAVRTGYLSLVLFHGWLEMAIYAYWASCLAAQATERSWSRDAGIQRASV